MSEEIEVADVVEIQPGKDLEVRAPEAVNLFRTEDPDEVIAKATATADALAKVVRDKELTKQIQGKQHVLVEGWTLLGTMLGVFPVLVWTKKLSNPEGWEARVEARTLSGAVVGAAEAQCTRDEDLWSHTPTNRQGNRIKARDDFALRSMAQTRATAKALRQPLGFVMTLAGYAATPAEEMPADERGGTSQQPRLDNRPPNNEDKPEQAQWNRMTGILQELAQLDPPEPGGPSWDTIALDWVADRFGKTSAALTKDELHMVNEEFEKRLEDAKLPFRGSVDEKTGTA